MTVAAMSLTGHSSRIGLNHGPENQIAFITGGESRLDLSIAKTFRGEGAKIMILDFNLTPREVADENGAKFFRG
ncbi:hypothetical protein CGQ24_14005 [Arthrobacter sp. 7749]|nr:hypothetical protein CGQ24_14005 [Arthrobacter sp. 7749]